MRLMTQFEDSRATPIRNPNIVAKKMPTTARTNVFCKPTQYTSRKGDVSAYSRNGEKLIPKPAEVERNPNPDAIPAFFRLIAALEIIPQTTHAKNATNIAWNIYARNFGSFKSLTFGFSEPADMSVTVVVPSPVRLRNPSLKQTLFLILFGRASPVRA